MYENVVIIPIILYANLKNNKNVHYQIVHIIKKLEKIQQRWIGK